MRLTTTQILPFAQQKVWEGLFNPTVLAQSLPGIEQFTPSGEQAYRIVVNLHLPVVTGQYEGSMEVIECEPVHRYRIQGQAKGRLGWVKLDALFELVAIESAATQVEATMDFRAGGMLGSVGERLMEGMAKGMMEDFFAKFSLGLSAPETGANNAPPANTK